MLWQAIRTPTIVGSTVIKVPFICYNKCHDTLSNTKIVGNGKPYILQKSTHFDILRCPFAHAGGEKYLKYTYNGDRLGSCLEAKGWCNAYFADLAMPKKRN